MDIKEIADNAGGVVALSTALGLSRGAVSQWQVVPSDRVRAVCEATAWKVTPHQVRPDLYPNPNDALPSHIAPPAPPCKCASEFGEFGEPRNGDRREGERRQQDGGVDCDLGEPRDGDRRQDDRRDNFDEAAA